MKNQILESDLRFDQDQYGCSRGIFRSASKSVIWPGLGGRRDRQKPLGLLRLGNWLDRCPLLFASSKLEEVVAQRAWGH